MNATGKILARLVEARFGLVSDGGSPLLTSALDALARRCGLPTAAALELAQGNTAMLRELAGHLGVAETYFFRHPALFEALVNDIVGKLERQPHVVVWSVGCCRGEEAYSLAIALEARLGAAWASHVTIRGCDISLQGLAAARAGVYGRWSFRAGWTDAQRRAFVALDGERWQLRDELRAALRFEHLSAQELASQLEHASVDVLLFRNVAVYFAPEAVQPLYAGLCATLRPEGLLCVATTDPVPEVPGLIATDVTLGIHVKRAAPLPRAAPPPAPLRTALPGPERNAPALAPPLATTAVQSARQLADAGEVDAALAVLDAPGAEELTAEARYLLRGQLCVAAGRLADANDELRRLLYLQPGHLLGRYWAALALSRTGATSPALAHVRELGRLLESVDAGAALEDGVTTAGELDRALVELLERWT
jgi:chemotaxis protein methyltransferase CheR